MGIRYQNYEDSLTFLNLEELSVRRDKLCLTFVLKCFIIANFGHILTPIPNVGYNDSDLRRFVKPQWDTDRYHNSLLVYLPRILNEYFSTN